MKKKLLIAIVCAAASLCAVAQQAVYTPTEANLRARQEFQNNKLGVFIHWGVYSMLADGEWVMLNKKIDRDEYAQLPAGFYPSRFDADEWVRTIKDAVESALSQKTSFKYNVIVVDNHSTDGTSDMLSRMLLSHSDKLHVIVPERSDLGIGGYYSVSGC